MTPARAHFDIKPIDAGGGGAGWTWVLVASNGEPVANATEVYRDEADAKRGALGAVEAAEDARTFRQVDQLHLASGGVVEPVDL